MLHLATELVNRRIGESGISPFLRFSASPVRHIAKQFLLLFLIILVIVPAQETTTQVRAGAAFLKILPGVRSHGLAGGYTGVIDEMHTIYANPGAAGFLREWQWATSYTRWIADSYHLSGLYGKQVATPWGKKTRLAFGLHYQGVGDFNSTADRTAAQVGANDALFSLSIGNPLNFLSKNVSFGTNVKFLRSQLADDAATSWMFDLGLLYKSNRFPVNILGFQYGILSAGVSTNHLGQPLNFVGEDTPLPRSFRTGAAFNVGTHDGLQVQFSADYSTFRDEVSRFSFGTEVFINNLIGLRGGYHLNDNEVSSFAFGLSLKFGNTKALPVGKKNAMRIDMAFWEGNTFFRRPQRYGLNHFPLGPEKFHLNNTFADQNRIVKQNEAVDLSWETSRDPDLYDNVKYVLLYAAGDAAGNALGELVDKTRKDPDYPLILNGGDTSSRNFFDVISDTTVANGKISYKSESDNLHSFQYVNKGFSEKENKHELALEPPLNKLHEAGNHRWAVLAYDLDNHIRFAEEVGHFQVPSPPIPPQPTIAYDLEIKSSVVKEPFKPPINFEFKSHTPKEASIRELDYLTDALSDSLLKNTFIKLGGHTDQVGSFKYNKAYSTKRVNSVKNHLLNKSGKKTGIDESRIFAHGYGREYPINDAYKYLQKPKLNIPLIPNNIDTLVYIWRNKKLFGKIFNTLDTLNIENRRVEIHLLKQANTDTTNKPIADSLIINALSPGNPVTYNLKIVNNGPDAAENFTVSTTKSRLAVLDTNSLHINTTLFTSNYSMDSLSWNINALASGDSIIITYNLIIKNEVIPANPYIFADKSYVTAEHDTISSNNTAYTDAIYVIGKPKAPAPDFSSADTIRHTVQCGEVLSIIAEMYYENASSKKYSSKKYWQKIQQANNKVITDTINYVIHTDSVINIPNPTKRIISRANAIITKNNGNNVQLVVGDTLEGHYKYNNGELVPQNVAYVWYRNGIEELENCKTYTVKEAHQEADKDNWITLKIKSIDEDGNPADSLAAATIGPIKDDAPTEFDITEVIKLEISTKDSNGAKIVKERKYEEFGEDLEVHHGDTLKIRFSENWNNANQCSVALGSIEWYREEDEVNKLNTNGDNKLVPDVLEHGATTLVVKVYPNVQNGNCKFEAKMIKICSIRARTSKPIAGKEPGLTINN